MENKQESLEEYKVRNLYLKVLRDFPKVNGNGTEVRFSKKADLQVSINYNRKISDMPYRIATMEFGSFFLTVSEEEKEASIAHEVGHFNYWAKNCNYNVMMRKKNWDDKTKFSDKHRGITYLACILSGKNRRRLERLQKRYIAIEIRADNEAAKAGYAKPLLSVLKKFSSNYGKQPEVYKKEMITRINNLEYILGY